MFRIEHTDDLDSLLCQQDLWDRLTDGVPFRESSWLGPWWKHLRGGCEPYILVARDQNAELCGILPLCSSESRSQGRVLSIMGGGQTCSDYVSVLAADEDGEAIAVAMAEFLADAAEDSSHAWDFVDIDGVVEGDAKMIAFADALLGRGASLHVQSRMSTWYKPREGGWEEHLKVYGKTQRRKMRRWGQRIESTDGLSLAWPTTSDELHCQLDALIDMHQRRWNDAGAPGSYADQRCRDFAHETAEMFFRRGRIYLALLSASGQPIGGDLHYIGENRRMYCYSSGFEPDFAELEPGRVLMAEAIKYMYRCDLAGIDYLRGDEPYKQRMAAIPKRVLNIWAAAPTLWPRLRHAAWCTGFELKQWMRRRTGRLPIEVVDLTGGNFVMQ